MKTMDCYWYRRLGGIIYQRASSQKVPAPLEECGKVNK